MEILVVIAMVRPVAAQCADREIERVEGQVGREDRRRRLARTDEIGHIGGRDLADQIVAPDFDDDQARGEAALAQIIGERQIFCHLAIGKRQVEATVVGDFVLRQQGRARGAEDHAIVIREARQQAKQLRQALVERIIDLVDAIAGEVPQRVNQTVDGKARGDNQPGGGQGPTEIGAQQLRRSGHRSVRQYLK